jgi:hypothetical protein
MENGGQDMLDELYKEHIIPDTKHLPNMDITLGIKKNSSSEETQKVKKEMSEDEANKIRMANE